MGITYEDAVKAQSELEDKILADPNVVSVGVIAETNSFGEPTGDYAVQVGVISIDTYLRSQKHGQSAIPKDFLLYSEDTKEKKHIHVHVVREGKIEALQTSTKSHNDDIPTAMDEIPSSLFQDHIYTLKRRPSPCGQSIGHPMTSAGTLGLLLEYSEGPNIGKAYILSNNHVISANNLASVGDEILQPGIHDSGTPGSDTIALLHRWVPLTNSTFNYVDAAIAEVKGEKNWHHFVHPYISHIGVPGSIAAAVIGMQVEKVGRTTGHTQGEVISARYSTKITYPMGTLTFRNQIRTTSMSKGGDSGSCLIERGTKYTVGLLFAGSDTASYFNPMNEVLSALSKEHTNQYPSGMKHLFSSDYPLRILQKRSYSTMSTPINIRSFKTPTSKFGSLLGIGCLSIFSVTSKVTCDKAMKSVLTSDRLVSSTIKSSFFNTSSAAQFKGKIFSIVKIFKR